jgi:AraC-like DNA-binding protein
MRPPRILGSGLSGAAVAAQVGFHHQSPLIRHFKRIDSISPGSYAATRCE